VSSVKTTPLVATSLRTIVITAIASATPAWSYPRATR
jgi:hypothetical protein